MRVRRTYAAVDTLLVDIDEKLPDEETGAVTFRGRRPRGRIARRNLRYAG